MDTEDISTYGRVTKGVRLMRMGEETQVMTVAVVKKETDEEEPESTEEA